MHFCTEFLSSSVYSSILLQILLFMLQISTSGKSSFFTLNFLKDNLIDRKFDLDQLRTFNYEREVSFGVGALNVFPKFVQRTHFSSPFVHFVPTPKLNRSLCRGTKPVPAYARESYQANITEANTEESIMETSPVVGLHGCNTEH